MPYGVFDLWYKVGEGSGPGSSPDSTVEWRELLDRVIEEHRPKVVLDFGCGDWQHSCLIDWHGARYVGVDVSPTVVADVTEKYGSDLVEFHLFDPSRETVAEFLKRIVPDGVDLAICKDVIQHLPNRESLIVVRGILSSCRYLLLTNDIGSESDEKNVDVKMGDARHVDPRLPPFDLEAEELLRLGNSKTTFLIKGT